MKISNNIQNMLKVYSDQNKPAAAAKTSRTKSMGKDEVILSPEAKEVMSINQKLKAVSDVREEKVNALKTQIDNGTYQVDSKQLAEKVFQSLTGKTYN